MLSHVDDHATQAIDRVATQYKDSTRLKGIIEANADQWQAIDDALWQLATERYLFSDAEINDVTVNYEAEGDQLDVLGRIVGLERGSMTDAQYRASLKGQIKVLRSSGAAEELIAVYYCVEPSSTITITDYPPACFTLTLSDPITVPEYAVYIKFIRQARAAGVRGILCYQHVEDSNSLILSDAAAYPETSATTGLGDATDETLGGYLSGAQA